MTRLMTLFAVTATLAGDLVMLPAPAAAQATTSQITVFGNDPCPRSTDSEIYVCNRRPESERYRLPKNQQLQGTRQQRESWANKAEPLMTVGSTGTGSCSAVGPGGHTGCLVQEINRAKRESREGSEANQPPE